MLSLILAAVTPFLIEDFENVKDMRVRTARAKSAAISSSSEQVKRGKHSGKLEYDFRNADVGTSAAYAQHRSPVTIPERPLRIGLWVYGNGARVWLRGEYRDGNGTMKGLDFTVLPEPPPMTGDECGRRSRGIDWQGWKYVEEELPADAVLPLKWERLIVLEVADVCDDASALFFDDLRAVYNDEEDLTSPEVRDELPAPGRRVYSSRPEISATVSDAETITVTLDGKVVPAAYDRTTDIVRYIPAEPLADGEHHVKINARDRAGNAALPSGDWKFIVYTGRDADPPRIDRALPLDGTSSLFGRPRLSARVIDEYRGVDPSKIELTVDETRVTPVWDPVAQVAWYSPPRALRDGTHKVSLRVSDLESPPNTSSATWAFTVKALAQPRGPFHFTWIADGGYFERDKESEAVKILREHLAAEKASPPAFIVFGGDIVENDQQINYDRARAALASVGVPALVAAGNHEISGTLSRERFWRTFGPTMGVADAGNVDFIVADLASSSFIWDMSQFGWIESELARSDARTVFVVLHAPTRDPFGSGHGVPEEEGRRMEAILAAAKRGRPARDIVVLSGDAHAYARWVRDDVTYIISGGGGGGLDAPPQEGGFFHRLHVFVDAAGVARVEVVRLSRESR